MENDGMVPGYPWFYSLKNPERWMMKGNTYLHSGDLENALQCYCQVIELIPHYQEAWKNRSWPFRGLEGQKRREK
jgi:tetratricopeptide (TPR) repeat protein